VILDYLNETEGPATHEEDISKLVLGKMADCAMDFRSNHLQKGKIPELVCPGRVVHAANFIRFVDGNGNQSSSFYSMFYKPVEEYEDELKWSIVNVNVSRKVQFAQINSQ
jgi:hypothetical protein